MDFSRSSLETEPRRRARYLARLAVRTQFHLRLPGSGKEERILQRGTVDLAVGFLGQRVVAHPARGEHVTGQARGQISAPALGGDVASRRSVGAADQPSLE